MVWLWHLGVMARCKARSWPRRWRRQEPRGTGGRHPGPSVGVACRWPPLPPVYTHLSGGQPACGGPPPPVASPRGAGGGGSQHEFYSPPGGRLYPPLILPPPHCPTSSQPRRAASITPYITPIEGAAVHTPQPPPPPQQPGAAQQREAVTDKTEKYNSITPLHPPMGKRLPPPLPPPTTPH